jgi:branched-chain amino acid aminotransferase
MAVYYIDGTFVDEGEAVLPVRDLIILRGYGVFDFLRTYNGRPFHLEEHLTRLRNSARLIGLHCPWSNDELASIVHQTLARNDFEESNIRLLVTGGDSEDGISPGPNPRLVVLIGDALRFPETCYRDGVKIITARLNRYIPGAKSIDYIRAIVTLKDAKAAGAVESIYVTDEDHVLEGTTSNLFIVKAGVVSTASEDILPGITRDVLLKILKPEFELQVRPVLRQELLEADEAFLASSNKEVMPVVAVDDQAIAGGRPGPVTRKVMSIFRDYTDRYGRQG